MGRDGMRYSELILAGAVGSDLLQPMSARRDFDNARVAIAVGDVDIVLGIPGDISWPVKRANRALRMWVPFPAAGIVKTGAAAFDKFLEVIDGLRRAAKL